MTDLFLTVLNMSITASYVAFAVILVRFLLRRAPKIFSYMLWLVVLMRLIIPVSFASSFSLFRLVNPQDQAGTGFMDFVPKDIGMMQKNPVVDVGIKEISGFINSSLPAAKPLASVNPMQMIVWIGSIIWITVAVLLLFHSVISYLRVIKRVQTATLVEDNVYETDQITTPFVCGFRKPKIFIPIGISKHELSYILLHEQTHITRRDYLIKPFAYLILIVHWFNPLMWLSYVLMCKDMEMSCDERVVARMGNEIKGSYSTSLLLLSMKRSGLPTSSPLAFGESHVKVRIKNIIAYRQPSSWKIAGYFLVVIALVLGCSANPEPLKQLPQESPQALYSGYNLDQLMKNKTLYIGNASKVGGLIGGMRKPTGVEWNGMELQTTAQPYGLTIHYVSNGSAVVNNEEVFYRNSMLLLSLIDNVDIITYSIVDNMGQAENNFTITREEVEKLLGEDVRLYASDQTSLRQLIDRLDTLPFKGM